MKLLIALALALAPLRAHADGPPAKGLRAFEPGDKKFVDASSRDAAWKPPSSRDAPSTRVEGKTRAFATRTATDVRCRSSR